MNHFAKLSLWIVRIGLFLTLAMPLLVFKSTVFPYLVGRVVIFQIIIEIIFPFFLYLVLRHPEYRPKFNIVFYASSAYFLALFASAIFGVDWLRSFWGYRDRMDGLFTMLHFYVFFLMLASIIKERREWFWYFNAALIPGLIAIFDNFSIAVKAMLSAGYFFLPREGGLFGNVLFYAAFVILEIFVALFLWFSAEKRWQKIIYGFCAGLFTLAVGASLTRGAILGLAAAVFLAAGVWGLSGNRRRKIFTALILLAAILSVSIIFSLRNASVVKDNSVLSRITSISTESDTGETRVIGWRAAASGFLERPVLGWGYINFYVPFNKYYNPKLLGHSVNETWFDRAHNIVFEHLATTGALGLLAYLFFLGAVIFYSLRSKETGKKILAIGIAAYFFQNLFSIDNFAVYLLFYILVAFIAHDKSEKERPAPKSIPAGSPPDVRRGGGFLIFLALAASLWSIYEINWKTFALGRKELSAASAGDIKISAELYRDALSIKTPYTAEAKMAFIKSIAAGIQRGSFNDAESKILLETAKEVLDASTARRAKNSAHDYFLFGRLYSELGRYDRSYFDQAEAAFARALELSPGRQQIYFGWAREKAMRGEIEEAKKVFQKAIDLAPEVADMHWYVGVEYNNLGLPEAINEFIAAYNLGYSPKTMGEAKLMMDALIARKEFAKIPKIYELMISWDPKNASLYAELAALYLKLGEKEKARAAAVRAMELDESFEAEGKIFLKMIDSFR